jgi:hypothetical protein
MRIDLESASVHAFLSRSSFIGSHIVPALRSDASLESRIHGILRYFILVLVTEALKEEGERSASAGRRYKMCVCVCVWFSMLVCGSINDCECVGL